MLAQRRRRWANISPALVQHLVFDCLHIESAGQKTRMWTDRWMDGQTGICMDGHINLANSDVYMATMFNFSVLDQKKTKSNEGGR